jgi:SAM-dependent methyltransferase
MKGAPLIDEPAAPLLQISPGEITDWDAQYRCGTPPWETGLPAAELVRVVREGVLRPMPILELGCGTGADAVFLAQRGFEVTAVDLSPTAIERARTRAERSGALLRIVLDDVFEFAEHCGSFDLVYDAGFYQYLRRTQLSRLLDLLWRMTSPGSLYFALAPCTGKEAEGELPPVSEEEIRYELGRLFEFIDLRPLRLEGPDGGEGNLGWSCLMRRPIVAGRSSP